MSRFSIALLLTAVCAVACGGGADTPEGTAAAEPASTSDTGLVTQQTIDNCAGFTAQQAAALLGLDPAIVNDYSRTEGSQRNCVYRQADRNTGIVSFALSRRDSVDAAKRLMSNDREAMTMADRAISGATGTESKEPAAQDMSAIGDEAFYSPLNGTIVVRVANAVAYVSGPDDMALKKRAAEQVAQGLRP
jgi:hypothetical protein